MNRNKGIMLLIGFSLHMPKSRNFTKRTMLEFVFHYTSQITGILTKKNILGKPVKKNVYLNIE